MKIQLKPLIKLKTTLTFRVVAFSTLLFVIGTSIILLYNIFGSNKAALADSGIEGKDLVNSGLITLKSFSAVANDNAIKLLWTTSSEINNDYYKIEYSRDGIIYTPIAKMNGSGSSTDDNNYSYEDNRTNNNDSYYQLRQIGYDGKSKIFGPLHVKLNQMDLANSLTAAEPIPFNDHLTINYSVKTPGINKLEVISVLGKILITEMVISGEGTNSFTFNDLSFLPEGIYFIRMISPGDVQSMKVIKQR